MSKRSKQFKLSVDLGNAAFEPAYRAEEIARILREVAKQIEGGSSVGGIMDVNGNSVGRYEVKS